MKDAEKQIKKLLYPGSELMTFRFLKLSNLRTSDFYKNYRQERIYEIIITEKLKKQFTRAVFQKKSINLKIGYLGQE